MAALHGIKLLEVEFLFFLPITFQHQLERWELIANSFLARVCHRVEAPPASRGRMVFDEGNRRCTFECKRVARCTARLVAVEW